MRKNAKQVRVSAESLAMIEETSKLSRVPVELVTEDAISCGLKSEQFEAIYGPMIEFRKPKTLIQVFENESVERDEGVVLGASAPGQALQDAQLQEVHGSEGAMHAPLHGETLGGEEEC